MRGWDQRVIKREGEFLPDATPREDQFCFPWPVSDVEANLREYAWRLAKDGRALFCRCEEIGIIAVGVEGALSHRTGTSLGRIHGGLPSFV